MLPDLTLHLSSLQMTILTESVLYVKDLKPIEAVLRRTTLDIADSCPNVAVVDLTGAGTIEWCFTRMSDQSVITRTAAVESATDGHISYTFVLTDFDTDFTPGNYKVSVRAVLASGEDYVVEARCCPSLRVVADPCER
jgi:hypothetical protein